MNTSKSSTSTFFPTNYPVNDTYAPVFVMRKLAFQPSDVDQVNSSRRNSLRRHATPDFLLASPADRDYSQVPFQFGQRGSGFLSSPSPDLPSLHFAPPPWPRGESIDSEYSGGNESSLENANSSCEDYDGVEIDDPGEAPKPGPQPKPSPQVSIMRRGSQDSVTGALRVTRPTPATPRIVHHSLPPLGYTPMPTGVDSSSVILGSVKHGRPLEAMCVDLFERKKRRVGGSVTEIGRFRTDFSDVHHIGKGSFSDVFKVRSRIDGQVYAIKRLKRSCQGDADRQKCEREASLHALITQSSDQNPILASHILRYHTSWFEEGRLFLQTEYCPQSLPDVIADTGGPLNEPQLLNILREVGNGLRFLHSLDLVHLDVKPANILISSRGVFKIGDLGLVSPAGAPAEVTSGDARYLPREILFNNYRHLPKADVFSLGATVLECMLAVRLEAEGEEWHRLRDGHLPLEDIQGYYSNELIELLTRMMASDPENRPSTELILDRMLPLVEHAVAETTRPLRAALSAVMQSDDEPEMPRISSNESLKASSPGESIMRSLKHTRQKLRKLFTTT